MVHAQAQGVPWVAGLAGAPSDLEEYMAQVPVAVRPVVISTREATYRSATAQTNIDFFLADGRGVAIVGVAEVEHRVILSPHRAVGLAFVAKPHEARVKTQVPPPKTPRVRVFGPV